MDYIHLLVDQNWLRSYYKSKANYRIGARCFNGNFHAKLTSDKSRVTCPQCIKLMKA